MAENEQNPLEGSKFSQKLVKKLKCPSPEFRLIRSIVNRYPIVSIDSEYPGVIFPSPNPRLYFNPTPSQNYALMKANVDNLNIIQIGLTLSDSRGNLPNFDSPNCFIWQFNFSDFDVGRDPHNPESIEMLMQQGIDLLKNKEEGIKSSDFARELLGSGLIMNHSHVTWVTFHGAYDFGFLMKILNGTTLPHDICGFMWLVVQYFGIKFYDLKYLMRFCNGLYGGLEKVANILSVSRVAGKRHEAGSDSLLTLQTFLRLKDVHFIANREASVEKFSNVLYDLKIPA